MSPSKLVYPKNVLPSDTRFRDDIYQLYTSNMEKAGERKELLEARARRDRELRISALQTRKPN